MRKSTETNGLRSARFCLALFLLVTLGACGGGGGGGGGNNDDGDDGGDGGDGGDATDTYILSVTANNLAQGESLLVSAAGQSLRIDEPDTPMAFADELDDGTSWNLSVEEAPEGQACEVIDTDGTIDGNDASARIDCHNPPAILSARNNVDLVEVDWRTDAGLREADRYDIAWSGVGTDGDDTIENVTPPYTLTVGEPPKLGEIIVTAHYGDASVSAEASRRLSGIAFESRVRDSLSRDDGSIWLAGDFAFTGLNSGAAARLDRRDGRLMAFPAIIGTVYALLPDDDGGIYVAGDLEFVDGQARQGVVRVRADGSLDPDWTPEVDGPVFALAEKDDGLMIGGSFGAVAGDADHGYLTRLTADGSPDADWSGRNPGGPVRALAVFDNRVIAGGEFTGGGADYLAGYDSDAMPLGLPQPDAPVETLLVADGTLYLGGSFGHVNGQERSYLARLDDALALDTWRIEIREPDPDDYDQAPPVAGLGALAYHNDTLYIGGAFGAVENTTRRNLAAIDDSGQPTAWNPMPDHRVQSLLVDNDSLLVGGAFRDIGSLGDDRPRDYYRLAHLARLSLTDVDSDNRPLADISQWVGADGSVQALAATTDSVLVGGRMAAIGYWLEGASGLAILDADHRLVTDRRHQTSGGGVRDILATPDHIYLLGDFQRFTHPDLSSLRQFAVRFESDGSLDTDWELARPDPGELETGVLAGPRLVLGGDFEQFLLQGSVDRLAGMDANGNLDAGWRQGDGPDDRVNRLTLINDRIFAAGAFTEVDEGGSMEPRDGFAAFDANSGDLLAWTAPGAQEAGTLATHDGELVLGLLGASDWEIGRAGTDGDSYSTEMTADEPVHRLISLGDRLVVTGAFNALEPTGDNPVSRAGVAILVDDGGTLTVDGFNPPALKAADGNRGRVDSAFMRGGRICVTGEFTRAEQQPRAGLACFSDQGELQP